MIQNLLKLLVIIIVLVAIYFVAGMFLAGVFLKLVAALLAVCGILAAVRLFNLDA
jgi:hypothetical protein